jgi:hypothetical protein
MQKMTRRALGVAGLALMVSASAAFAQAPVRVRGEITKVDGTTLSVKTREGQDVIRRRASSPTDFRIGMAGPAAP